MDCDLLRGFARDAPDGEPSVEAPLPAVEAPLPCRGGLCGVLTLTGDVASATARLADVVAGPGEV